MLSSITERSWVGKTHAGPPHANSSRLMGARFALTWLFSMVERHSVRCGDVAVSKWKAVLLAELCDENIESSCRPAVVCVLHLYRCFSA